ncbi:MAG: KH domain-containing protein, partial [Candidatus Cybelea sp.]
PPRPAQAPPRPAQAPPRQAHPRPARAPERRDRRPTAPSSDPWAGHRRASELLTFLARKLVANPENVAVELFVDESAQPVIELIVHPDDLGKVIGRGGRVAHALRTIVRATAEGRVAVDILDSDEAAEGPQS